MENLKGDFEPSFEMRKDTNLFSRREFISLTAAGIAAISVPNIFASNIGEQVWEKRLRVPNADTIKALQFTDVHFFCGIENKDEEKKLRQKTLDDTRRLIDRAKPDLLFVTGDLWHDNPDGRGEEFMAYAVEQCNSWGIPWAFTWGNHDQLNDYSVGHKTFQNAPKSLYGGEKTDGNYVITIEDNSGIPLVEFLCLNSKRDGLDAAARDFTSNAIKALNSRGDQPLRIGAFHIPVRQYEDVWDNGIARGIIGEKVCFEKEERAALPILKSASIHSVFCGHDHVNDYEGKFDGVNLIYGRATGHNGYGAEKMIKGAKLYTLNPKNKTLSWESLLVDGSTWKPLPEQRTDLR